MPFEMQNILAKHIKIGTPCKRCFYRRSKLLKRQTPRNMEESQEVIDYIISDHCDVGLKSILRSIVSFYCIKLLTYFDLTKAEIFKAGQCSKVHAEIFIKNELLGGRTEDRNPSCDEITLSLRAFLGATSMVGKGSLQEMKKRQQKLERKRYQYEV